MGGRSAPRGVRPPCREGGGSREPSVGERPSEGRGGAMLRRGHSLEAMGRVDGRYANGRKLDGGAARRRGEAWGTAARAASAPVGDSRGGREAMPQGAASCHLGARAAQAGGMPAGDSQGGVGGRRRAAPPPSCLPSPPLSPPGARGIFVAGAPAGARGERGGGNAAPRSSPPRSPRRTGHQWASWPPPTLPLHLVPPPPTRLMK